MIILLAIQGVPHVLRCSNNVCDLLLTGTVRLLCAFMHVNAPMQTRISTCKCICIFCLCRPTGLLPLQEAFSTTLRGFSHRASAGESRGPAFWRPNVGLKAGALRDRVSMYRHCMNGALLESQLSYMQLP